jgi:AraC family transcriptional activator of pobA
VSAARPLELVRLAGGPGRVEVHVLDGASWETTVREPHRHDFHELIFVRSGSGVHLLDDRRVEAEAGTVTLIGRGQVHVFAEARDVRGSVVRFDESLLFSGGDGRVLPTWLLSGRGSRTVHVPRGAFADVEAVIRALAGESAGLADARTAEVERHLLSVLLLWLERWYDASRTERREGDDASVELHRRFAQLLEEDHAAHHDAAHYADRLGLPAAALSRALSQVTGRTTKELVLDRVMLEAARLLRFTDLSVQEVALRTGFRDPFYFSRAFKRASGAAPQAFRAEARGKSRHP